MEAISSQYPPCYEPVTLTNKWNQNGLFKVTDKSNKNTAQSTSGDLKSTRISPNENIALCSVVND